MSHLHLAESRQDIPADWEPGFTEHRVESDIEFLAFALGEDGMREFVAECVNKARRRKALAS